MKVWLVTQTWDGDGTQIIAVFSSLKRAESFVALAKKEHFDTIESWLVNAEPEIKRGRILNYNK